MKRLTGPILATAVIAAIFLGVAPTALATVRYDTRPPTVAITAPSAGQDESGTVSVTGTAGDNVRVSKVALSVDGSSFVPALGTTQWSEPLDTSKYPDGTHTIRARAWDRRGNRHTTSMTVSFSNAAPPPAPHQDSLDTPEGTHIDVDTSGPWSAQQVYDMLKANGLDSTIGQTLTVKVQDQYASSVTTHSGTTNGTPWYTATMWLKGVNSGFSVAPDSTVGHEYGHVWTLYHLAMQKNGDWSSYLQARGLANDSRVNSAYEWTPAEMIADDYRLLFGSSAAISETPHHLNTQIPDPRDVPGLKDFLLNSWSQAS